MSAPPFYGTLGRFTWRMLATVLAGEAMAVFFGALVARGLAAARGEQSAPALLLVGSGLAVLCLLGAAMMRRPWGLTFGWLVQVATFATAFVVPAMVVVGLIFLGLWLLCLAQGRRIDALQEQRAAAAGSDPEAH